MRDNLHPSPILIQRRAACLEAIRRHFVEFGVAPTQAELAARIGIARHQVGRLLERLAAAGEIAWAPGVRRGITLPDRLAMVATSELVLALRSRSTSLQDVASSASCAQV